jgi:nitrogenase molybdenum-iron protein beta chain
MIALCTTCMAEVIGDDLGAFITTAKQDGHIPEDLPVPFAHTPSFVGSHITGYDNMLKSILSTLTKDQQAETTNGKFNFNLGFDPYIGNIRELKRILGLFGIDYTILSDNSDTFDSPNTGEFKMYNGLTTLADTADAINAEGSFFFQKYTTPKTQEYITQAWDQKTYNFRPFGIKGTDEFLMALSAITGKAIPLGTPAGAGAGRGCADRFPGLDSRQEGGPLWRSGPCLWHHPVPFGNGGGAGTHRGHQQQHGL